jgi:hypothetical protein
MQILELSAQGVRGFSPSARAELPTGYTVVTPPSKEPVALAGLLTALLFPDGRGGEVAFLDPKRELGNASLMFRGNDGATYYLARELGGVGAIHRANDATAQWELLTEETTEIIEYLRSHVGLPAKKQFEQAFTLVPGQFPSRKPKARSTAHVESAASRLPGFQSASKATDVPAARAKLAELTQELSLSSEIERWQFQLDGIVTQLSEVETWLARGAELKTSLERAEAAYASAPSPESLKLPKDIAERVKRFSQLVSKRDEALAKLDQERGNEVGFAVGSIEPLKRNPRFWAAAALGTAFFAAGILLKGAGRYLALLDIPAFGFAAMLALRYVDDLQRAQTQSRKGERRAVREKKIAEDFEAEAQWVKKAMAALKVESTNEIADALARRSQQEKAVQELRSQVTALETDPEYAASVAKGQQLKRDRDAIEAKISEKGGYVRDAGEVQREIDRIKKSIEAPQSSPSALMPAGPSVQGGPAAAAEDPFPALLALAGEMLMVDPATAGNLIRDRCNQHFFTLTDRRYGGLELDRTGKGWVLARGQRIAVGEVPAKDLDLLFLSARLALLEHSLASRGQFPLVIDDLSPVFDAGRLAILGPILKHLGTATQVLHVSADPGVQALADSAASL